MKKKVIIIIGIVFLIAFILVCMVVYSNFFEKNYIFKDISNDRINHAYIYLDDEAVAELNKNEIAKAFDFLKDISVYRQVESTQELSFKLGFYGFEDIEISWNEEYIEYDGLTYRADKKSIVVLEEYCELIIAEHNDTTPKKPYELSAENISSVKLTYDITDYHVYDVSIEDFSAFVECVNGITTYERYNEYHSLWGNHIYTFDVALKSGEVLQVRISDGIENTEHIYLNDKTYVSDASKLMDFIGACTVTE